MIRFFSIYIAAHVLYRGYPHIIYYAKRNIKRGDELLIDFGEDHFDGHVL